MKTPSLSKPGEATALPISLEDVQAARERIRGHIHETALKPTYQLGRLVGCNLYFKFENQQRTGSFKIRGAMNKLLTLTDEERARGVVAASAGNHAQGVALASTTVGVKATVVMPQGATLQKVAATKNYGAEVVLHGDNYDESYQHARSLQQERGATFVHAYNDPAIMAGQGTVGLEILEALPDVDVIVCGVGGGGLLSGVATAAKGIKPDVRIVAVQPARSAYLPQSLGAGELVAAERSDTIADGLATKHGGALTFEVLRRVVDECVTVSEEEIAHAILVFLERQKNVVEGAGAVGLAALLAGKVSLKPTDKVAVVVSGGNIDINFLDAIIKRGLHEAGRVLRFSTMIADKPGQLRNVLDVIAKQRSNVLDIRHIRNKTTLPLNQTELEIVTETRGPNHQEALIKALKDAGYQIEDSSAS